MELNFEKIDPYHVNENDPFVEVKDMDGESYFVPNYYIDSMMCFFAEHNFQDLVTQKIVTRDQILKNRLDWFDSYIIKKNNNWIGVVQMVNPELTACHNSCVYPSAIQTIQNIDPKFRYMKENFCNHPFDTLSDYQNWYWFLEGLSDPNLVDFYHEEVQKRLEQMELPNYYFIELFISCDHYSKNDYDMNQQIIDLLWEICQIIRFEKKQQGLSNWDFYSNYFCSDSILNPFFEQINSGYQKKKIS